MATVTITGTVGSATTLQFPADVTTVNVTMVGGGGSGGGISGLTGRGGGGGGGAYCANTAIGVSVNTLYALSGGQQGNAGAGGDSYFQVSGGSDLMRAKGGGGAPVPGSGAGGSGGTHTTGSTAGTGGTVNQGGDGGAGGASSGQAAGGGAGAGGPTGAGSNGTAGTSGTSSGGGAGGAGGGTVNGGTGHGGQGSGTTNANNGQNSGQTSYGSGGGGATRTSNGSAAGGLGTAGIALLTFTTLLPYVVQTLRSAASTASGGTFTLAAVGTGNTVVAMLTSNDGTGSIVSATLGGVAGRKIAGASQPYSAGVSCLGETWVWENVTGAPTALVVTTSGGTQTGYAVSVWEVGNPGTVSPGQSVVYYTSGAATITPAAPVNGALELVGCADKGANSLSTFQTFPASPWLPNGVVGAQWIVGASWPVSGTTSQLASWTDNATTAEKTIMAVVVNPKASRSAHAIIGQ